jgi:hypothetical protein
MLAEAGLTVFPLWGGLCRAAKLISIQAEDPRPDAIKLARCHGWAEQQVEHQGPRKPC